MRVGIYSAGGGPALVQQGENGRGPQIGINFSRRQGGRDEPTQERTGTSAPGEAKKSARRLLKLRRFLALF